MPRHEIEIAPFRLARFPVTNAEWSLFLEAGGYEDESFWDSEGARRWKSGETTADGTRVGVRYWWRRFREDPPQLEIAWESGQLPKESYERWKERLTMTEAEFESHLKELYPGGKLREPRFWRHEAFNNPAQPVVGVSWFEARAYCRWISAQTGEDFRLPSEAEWEAAARGREGRRYPWGDEFDPLRANTAETRLKRTAPVGVFPAGDTPEGVTDLAGNVTEWTDSLFGPGMEFEEAPFAYPYRSEDGREESSAAADVRRVLRGGAWNDSLVLARSASRTGDLPDLRDFAVAGLRLASSG
jgi:formylglycine-generating enzyme required for sulfatase activity